MHATASTTTSGSGMILGISGGGNVVHRPSASSSSSARSPLTPVSESSVQNLYGITGLSTNSSTGTATTSGSGSAGRLITICVVGWSGTEKEKGAVGVGKSCLCNRFVRPLEDDYRVDHISTLSQVDFGGRVINNDHWLYWGERTLFTDDASELTIRVLEQTEFVDDESFQPLKASSANQRDPYVKRCAAVRLQSADKLMYISKEQLGIEHEYEQRPLPDGKANVDGFICVYDVGAGAGHQPHSSSSSSVNDTRQFEFVSQVLQNLLKTRKPVVLVTSKNDEADDRLIREAERLLQSKKEFRNSIPLIESSSHRNVNVEGAFMVLASLIERQKTSSAQPKLKPLTYHEAEKNRREIMDVAAAAYVQKLKSTTRDDHRISWIQISRQLADDPDFVHFCELCGTASAQRLFKQHVKESREKYTQRRLQAQINRLPEILPLLLPDLTYVRGKNWKDMLEVLASLPHFDEYFQPLGVSSSLSTDGSLEYSPSSEDPRIPAELLYKPEADGFFRRHVTALEAASRRQRLQDEFAQLIAGCTQVTPGKPLSDVRIFFLGKECFESLPEGDLEIIYERYQNQLMKRARRDFVELLLEQVDEFINRALLRTKAKRSQSNVAINQQQSHTATSAVVGPPRTGVPSLPGLNERDWREIHEQLQEDARYRQLNRLHQLRDNLISQYISFVSHPLRQHCPAYPRCMDALVEQLLANHSCRPLSWNQIQDQCREKGSSQQVLQRPVASRDSTFFAALLERRMNVLVLGMDGLADQVIREFKVFLQNDLYLHGDTAYSFDYRSIESDDWTALSSSHFRPNGLICAFSSRSSFEYIRNTINRTLLNCDQSTAYVDATSSTPSLYGLPVVLLFAFDPSNLDDLPYLQHQGGRLADQWRSVFVGLEPSNRNIGHVTQDRRVAAQEPLTSPSLFTIEQLNRTMSCLLSLATTRAMDRDGDTNKRIAKSPNVAAWHPDASLTLCLMCGDDYAPELILGPLLNYQCDPPTMNLASRQAPVLPPKVSSNVYGQRRSNDLDELLAGDKSFTGFYVETFSPECGQKLKFEINVTSYHGTFVQISEHCYSHGYILVYSAKRRASLAHLQSISHLIPNPIPILVVAVGEVTEFFSDPATNSLITEGNQIADRMGARFITISKATEQQFSVYTPFLDEVWTKVSAVEAAGFFKHPSDAENRSGNYAPLSQFVSGYAQQTPRENPWYGDVSTPSSSVNSVLQPVPQQTNGPSNRPPPPPYSSATSAENNTRPSVIPVAMTRSIYYNEGTNFSNNSQRGGSAASGQSQAKIHKDRLSGSCLSMSGFGDQSSISSPLGAAGKIFDDPSLATPRKKFDNGSDGLIMGRLDFIPAPGSSTYNDKIYYGNRFASQDDDCGKSYLLRQRNSTPSSNKPTFQRRCRIGSTGDADSESPGRASAFYTSSAIDIHELPITTKSYRHASLQEKQERLLSHWKKAILGWWDSGSDGTLNRQFSHQPSSTKPISNIQQQGMDKFQRTASATASPSSRSVCMVPAAGHGNSIASPASSRQQFGSNKTSAGSQQQKLLGRINLQHLSNVTDSISSKFTGRKPSGLLTNQQIQLTAVQQVKEVDAVSAAPLATPESIELGAEYMTVKDALGESAWPKRDPTSQGAEYYGDDEEQYATVDSVFGAGTNSGIQHASVLPTRPPRRSDSSGGGDKTASTIDSTSSGDSSSVHVSDQSTYNRVGRKPTPHRSKAGRRGYRSTSSSELTTGGCGPTIAERVRQLNAALELGRTESPPAPAIPPYTKERMIPLTKRADTSIVLAQRRSASEESLLDPFLHHRRNRQPIFFSHKGRVVFDCPNVADEYDDCTYYNDISINEPTIVKPVNKRRFVPLSKYARRTKTTSIEPPSPTSNAGFVRKVTSSFRFRRRKGSDMAESRSMPQSPLLSSHSNGQWSDTTRVFVLPPLETSLMWSSNADGSDQSDVQAVSSSNWWSGSKASALATSRSPKKDSSILQPEKAPTAKERKISRGDQKKASIEAQAGKINKKKTRESSQAQLVPADATLQDLAASDEDPVPPYVRKCVEFVEATGLQVEGIYRVPGNQAHVVSLEQKFIEDPNVSFYDLDLPVNAIATSLKNFFSALNEPMVPYNLYGDLMEAMSNRQPEIRQDRVRQVLRRLPKENRAVLRYFIDHLRKIAQHCETTAMDHRNLAKCWWPTLLRPQFDSFETMTQMTQRLEDFVQLLLENPDLLR